MPSNLRSAALAAVSLLVASAVFVAAYQPARSTLRAMGQRVEAKLLGRSNPPTVSPPPREVGLRIDAGHVLRPISPLIYGVAAADAEHLTATGARLNRWGGNPNTRYNWTLGAAWNAARDWEFRNYGGPTSNASSAADAFIAGNEALRVQTVLTIPSIGWVARDGNNQTRSVGVPVAGGAPLGVDSEAIVGYDPEANRLATSTRSLARQPASVADLPTGGAAPVYQDQWVRHLVDRFGTADQGGVGFYVIDNEPDLWSGTHTDIHPVEPSYDDLLNNFVEYAEAIKDVDPSAQVLGPALSGWTSYFYSARDRGSDNFGTHADQRAHGGMPFLPWWLDQVRQHDKRAGHRTLDILDIHYYPQAAGVFSNADDPLTNRLRLRSTRALWDPTYVDESWINQPVNLIPRVRAWIDQYYPGTPLAINEWNWGAEKTPTGALAIADVLGIFGREGVDMAAFWTVPPTGSPGAYAFAMYTNFDGRGHRFGDLAVADTSTSPDDVSSYASLDSTTGELLVMAINKRADAALPTTVQVSPGYAPQVGAIVYDGVGAPEPLSDLTMDGSQVLLELPATSITLLRFQPAP